MSFADSTDDLLASAVYGETVTIMRNVRTYDNSGSETDTWASQGTVLADIQPNVGRNATRLPTSVLGEVRESAYRIFFPNGTNVLQGDRIRPAGWAAPNDEYLITDVLSDDGHVEALASIVKGHA